MSVDAIRPRPPRSQGFTLLELLIAITLLAVMSILAWRGLDGMLRTREALESRDHQLTGLRQLFAQFDIDCTHLASYSRLGHAPLELSANRLILIRDRQYPDAPGAWQVVQYQVRDGALMRDALAPAADHETLDAGLQDLRQGDGTRNEGASRANRFALLEPAASLSARVWLAPGGWQESQEALLQAFPAQNSDRVMPTGFGAITPAVRAIEIVAAIADGSTYRRICMTGL